MGMHDDLEKRGGSKICNCSVCRTVMTLPYSDDLKARIRGTADDLFDAFVSSDPGFVLTKENIEERKNFVRAVGLVFAAMTSEFDYSEAVYQRAKELDHDRL